MNIMNIYRYILYFGRAITMPSKHMLDRHNGKQNRNDFLTALMSIDELLCHLNHIIMSCSTEPIVQFPRYSIKFHEVDVTVLKRFLSSLFRTKIYSTLLF